MDKGYKEKDGKLPIGSTIVDFIEPIRWLAAVWYYGSHKYKDERNPFKKCSNWKLVSNGDKEYYDALMRHLCKIIDGENFDKESGLPHVAHFTFNALAFAFFKLKELEQGINE